MNIAPLHIHAAASARFCGGNALVRAVVLGCAMACASVPALADRGQDGQRSAPQQQEPRAERMAPPPRQNDNGRAQDMRAEEQRRQMQQQQQQYQQQQQQQQEQGARRGGRLTPDERRELRRQINEAGMDLYPNPPRR